MDGRDFAIRLKKIKAEVLALKQSHDYGVAQTDFPSYKVNMPIDYSNPNKIQVTAVFASDNMPYFSVLGSLITLPDITWNNGTLTYTSNYFELMIATFIFSRPAQSFTYQEIPG